MSASGVQAALGVVATFRPILEIDPALYAEVGRGIPIPQFSEETILLVCAAALAQFQKSPTVVDLVAPYYIIGDIHGNIFDLIRIIMHTRSPPWSRLLLLGDYVDRGEYSVEVVTLLFSLFVIYPDQIVLLRGNHEFESVNTNYGLLTEVLANYHNRPIFEAFNRAFMWMPLAAVVNESIMCVHGGIAPSLKSLQTLRALKRPLLACEADPICDLLWSDPSIDLDGYVHSARGLGVLFGAQSLAEFLDDLGMRTMIRAHQCFQKGVSRFGNDRLYTVFSCSAYQGELNRCGLLFLDEVLEIECFSFPPLDQIPRESVASRQLSHSEVLKACLSTNPLSVKLFEIHQSNLKCSAQKFSRSGILKTINTQHGLPVPFVKPKAIARVARASAP
jgi:protein phosphatase